ncbi:DUF3578 domain-containing protein [Bacillus sp. OVS6]|nr:DUF3578 domain-containing protein [Bacillus sp. OVS6]
MMRDIFLNIFDNYRHVRSTNFKPSENEIAKKFLEMTPKTIIEILLEKRIYKVQASVGQGNWTETPWIGIFNKRITETATKGFYIVYLFREDMSGVYLSLNQGTTYIKNKFKGRKPREKMEDVATKWRGMLTNPLHQFPETQIDLKSQTDNAKNYMAAHICGKFYSVDAFPTQEELIKDLHIMMQVYEELKFLMGKRNTEDMIDYLLTIEEVEDTQYQADILIANPTITLGPLPVPNQTSTGGRQQWKRNPSIAKESLFNANYQCEFDNDHITFTSEVSGENFVEAHHLIPMKLQGNFNNSLDVPGNIVSLCPNCHRMIHHASKIQREDIIKRLFQIKENELKYFNIYLTVEEIIDAYNKTINKVYQ